MISSFWGISAADFADAIKSASGKRINLRINSPGGDVFEARAMVAAINDARRNGKEVVTYVDGLAASAASYLALAADSVVMEDGAFLMIHNAWGFTIGNATEHDAASALLRKVDASIRADYAKKTGISDQQLTEWMDAETWFTAAEALEHGFIDQIAGADDTEGRENGAGSAAENGADDPHAENGAEEIGAEEIGARWSVAALTAFRHAPEAVKAAAQKRPKNKRNASKDEAEIIAANERRAQILALCGA